MPRHIPQRRRLSKTQRQELYRTGPFRNIVDRQSLLSYLEKESGAHSDYCFELMERELTLTEEQKQAYPEKHHIIPRLFGAPDENWNLVHVTYDEHVQVHQLRYEQYQEVGDRLALNLHENITETTRDERIESSRRGHETMRVLGISFWDPNVQSELGRRGAGELTPKREEGYQNQARTLGGYGQIFEKDLIFTYKYGEKIVEFETTENSFQRTGQIKPFLLERMDSSDPLKKVIENDRHFTSNFNKVLQRLLPNPNPRLQRNNYKGWSIRFK